MGLTAYDMSDMSRLAQLAVSPNCSASRGRYRSRRRFAVPQIQGAGLNQREHELMQEILRHLTRDVEMAIRIALAQRLAEDASVPHDLILLLVDDSIEVARPLILHSPLLTEALTCCKPDRRSQRRHIAKLYRRLSPQYQHAGYRRAGRQRP